MYCSCFSFSLISDLNLIDGGYLRNCFENCKSKLFLAPRSANPMNIEKSHFCLCIEDGFYMLLEIAPNFSQTSSSVTLGLSFLLIP